MSTVALEDIWDAPVVPSTPPRRASSSGNDSDEDGAPRPSKRPRSSLFLASDSDEDSPKKSRVAPSQRSGTGRADIDALFENDDDDTFVLAPALDKEALRREAEARYQKEAEENLHAIMPSSSPTREPDRQKDAEKASDGKKGKDAPKERKKVARLDEGRLLGPDGFPALIQEAKKFKPKGKGHEFWTHKLYPKTQFRDTVNRVEKLCHSKRMHVALSVWRDEAKGLINGVKVDDDPIDLTSDVEPDEENASKAATGSNLTDTDVHMHDSRPPTRPPSSASERPTTDDDEFDLDMMIRQEEEMRVEDVAAAANSNVTYRSNNAKSSSKAIDEDEEAMWAEMMAMGAFADDPPPPSSDPPDQSNVTATTTRQNPSDSLDDEDMWDIVREMESEQSRPSVTGLAGTSVSGGVSGLEVVLRDKDPPKPKPPSTVEEDWDEMYL
ncbi:hypothetical protein JAAARDRAFT_125198 [Jaapia argillacea MUCL 33604]|uniref:Chromosome segregation in meiosis protein n=1 Tax=Jaapia argillacea MUCL 33604 TaxID=933084 RepID=A0A067Q496_9AGAM|nr:hypothetical protein JAAARDRAFT_125198 [Jaapia argillacea MUCL 33604]